jgi:plasmid stabilization system protein ParE
MKKRAFKIEISAEAENDFDSSYSFYYDENPRLANQFFQRINTSLESIKISPHTFPVVHKNLRKYKVKTFPFVIYYQIDGFEVKVEAIFHTSRNPEIWNERVGE